MCDCQAAVPLLFLLAYSEVNPSSNLAVNHQLIMKNMQAFQTTDPLFGILESSLDSLPILGIDSQESLQSHSKVTPKSMVNMTERCPKLHKRG